MNRSEMLRRLAAGEDPLELSIEKWQDIVDGKGKNGASDNCALCEKYVICDVCLIFKKTGKCCDSTFYGDYILALALGKKDEAESFAQKELEFLKSLRKPKKKQSNKKPSTMARGW